MIPPLSTHPLPTQTHTHTQVRNNKDHFTSLHGKVGLLTLLLAALAPLGGLFSFRKLGLVTHLPEPWQPVVKWLHRCAGALTWVLALIVMQLPLPHAAVFQVRVGDCVACVVVVVVVGGDCEELAGGFTAAGFG